MKLNFSPSYHVFAFTGTTLDCTLLLQYNFAVTFTLNKHIKFLRFLIKKFLRMPCLSDGIKHTHKKCGKGFNTLLCKICCNDGEVLLMPCANIFLFTVPPSSALSSFLFVLHSVHFNDGLLR